jgi:tetratricopeptide (TPR) repeat protein
MKRRRETITSAQADVDARLVHIEPVLERAEAAARRRELTDAEALLAQAAAMSAVLFGGTATMPPTLVRKFARTSVELARAYAEAGDHDLALSAAGDALQQLTALLRERPSDRQLHSDRAGALQALSSVHRRAGHYEQASRGFEAAIGIRRALMTERTSSAEAAGLASCLQELGECFAGAGQLPSALGALGTAMRHWNTAAATDRSFQAQAAGCRARLGELERSLAGRRDELIGL